MLGSGLGTSSAARMRASFWTQQALARKPKWRMRRKPLGKTCVRKRRMNSLASSVIALDLFWALRVKGAIRSCVLQLTWLVRFDFSVFVSVGRYFAAAKSEWRIGQHPIDPVHIFTFQYPGPEPNCLTRPVSEHDQPHIRSPLETAAPTSRLRRAGAQA